MRTKIKDSYGLNEKCEMKRYELKSLDSTRFYKFLIFCKKINSVNRLIILCKEIRIYFSF